MRRSSFVQCLGVVATLAGIFACSDVGTNAYSSAEELPLAFLAELGTEGWYEVQPGVWERAKSDGGIQSIAVGTDGLEWAVARVEEHIAERRATDSPEEQLEELPKLVTFADELRAQIAAGGSSSRQIDYKCSQSWNAHAIAAGGFYNGTGWSDAWGYANWYSSCGSQGRVYVYAKVSNTYVVDQTTCGPTPYGTNRECNVSKHLSWGEGMGAYAKAWVSVPSQNIFLQDVSTYPSGGGGGGPI